MRHMSVYQMKAKPLVASRSWKINKSKSLKSPNLYLNAKPSLFGHKERIIKGHKSNDARIPARVVLFS
jgi:hypothetical protein